MKTAVFSTKPYDREYFEAACRTHPHDLHFFEPRLDREIVELAAGYEAVCAFVNDRLDAPVIHRLSELGVKAIALRCAGYNNVDLSAAKEAGIRVVRVPAYSPYAVAEHTVALILALNRNLHRAYSRVRNGNFYLGGLIGFDMHDRTIGVVGTGAIGAVFTKIMAGFGCRLLGFDRKENPECLRLGMEYVDLDTLLRQSDIVSLHCPLTPETHHLINADSIAKLRHGAMIINTSRGGVIDTKAVIGGLKSGKIGHLGIDVYEEESDFFFEDKSSEIIPDDTLSRLLTFPNVIVTGHQGFFTREALQSIAETTLGNLTELQNQNRCVNEV